MTLTEALAYVRQFHTQIGAPVAKRPGTLDTDPTLARRWIAELGGISQELIASNDPVLGRIGLEIEELVEWLRAHWQGDLNAAADAWADRAYLLLGDAVATGLPVAELFLAVHQSNLTKEPPETWQQRGRKGQNYRPPDLKSILDRARLAASINDRSED